MLLRNTLLFLSRQPKARKWMESSRLVRPVVRRFVAGDTLKEAIEVSRQLAAQGLSSTLDRLGENVTSLEEARESTAAAVETIQRLHGESPGTTVSIKLTQFGLDLSDAECRDNVARVAEAAQRAGSSIEIDMEASRYVDRTLAIVRYLHAKFGNVRAVIQAYLFRSMGDIDQLCREAIPVRLCKGAYLESAEVAFPDKAQVDANYRRLMRVLLERGAVPALATHDPRIQQDAVRMIEELQLRPEQYEFQMLYGIRSDLQRKLAGAGHRVRLYVPYGKAWYPYFMRRLAERPANVAFLIRQLVHV